MRHDDDKMVARLALQHSAPMDQLNVGYRQSRPRSIKLHFIRMSMALLAIKRSLNRVGIPARTTLSYCEPWWPWHAGWEILLGIPGRVQHREGGCQGGGASTLLFSALLRFDLR